MNLEELALGSGDISPEVGRAAGESAERTALIDDVGIFRMGFSPRHVTYETTPSPQEGFDAWLNAQRIANGAVLTTEIERELGHVCAVESRLVRIGKF